MTGDYDVQIYEESDVPKDIMVLIDSAFESQGVQKSDFMFCQYTEIYGCREVVYEHKEDDSTFYAEWKNMELTECSVTID